MCTSSCFFGTIADLVAGDGTLLLTERDLKSLKLELPASLPQHHLSISENYASQSARQKNAIAGVGELQTPTTAEVRKNRAMGNAQQTNLITGAKK
jgi:hypothetical protein